ncbi:hypothetical protein NMG60_11020228 [Bertholletia excelsa]
MKFSRTERIVLLIDLHPLVHLQNPDPYLTSILTSARTLLTFPSLSTSLFAFKLFFSSLSPLLSSSAVHRCAGKPSVSSLSFNHPSQTLDSLSETLGSLPGSSFSSELAISSPRASHVAGSLLQLVHDYAWDALNESVSGTLNDFPTVKSNLVLLLSPLCRSLKCLSEFMNVSSDDEIMTSVDSFCKSFGSFFGAVNDGYVSRNIHCSWIDVNFDAEYNEENLEGDKPILQLGIFTTGIRSLGWGFCSTDSIILGSALIPFPLIYPTIGVSFNFLYSNDNFKPSPVQLTLEILDVKGMPLECKCCDLELLKLKKPSRLIPSDIMHTLQFRSVENEALEHDNILGDNLGDRITDLRIRAVQKCKEDVISEGSSTTLILVRSHSGEPGKSGKKCSGSFFASRVIEMLSSEMGEFIHGSTIPLWQILLGFLCRKGYEALVSLSSGNGNSLLGILKPFTAHLALLSIIDDAQVTEPKCHGLKFAEVGEKICKPFSTTNNSTGTANTHRSTLSSENNVSVGNQNRKKNKKHIYQDLPWISFQKAAFEGSILELEESYFASKFNNCKKLRFLKCWMKQIINSSSDFCSILDGSKSCQNIKEEIGERLNGSEQESEQPIPLKFSVKPSEMQEEAALVSYSETSEVFFSNLPKKIQNGIESKGVDLQILAERLVNLSIYWLYQKSEVENSIDNQLAAVKSDVSHGKLVANNLVNILLKDPKALKEKYRDNNQSFLASDPGPTSFVPTSIVREYELQILLRMEMLRSKVADNIEASTKRKLVKQICLLLEIIQYLVEGGFHGHLSLYDYVEQTIKARYSHVLGNVVNKIYAQMDLLPYEDENESLIQLLNSEDSNHSWRDTDRHDVAETKRACESISADDESSHLLERNVNGLLHINGEEQARRLSEAQQRRERARRFVSFTTWVPDLQRVWAPKQPKVMKVKSESLQKQLKKRKERHRGKHDIVCETPMTGTKHSGSCPSGSVSKALFQDDW